MDLKNSVAVQLGMISVVTEVAESLKSRAWLRGGWGMDFALGRVTRVHSDIDIFVDNVVYNEIVEKLVERHWLLTNPHSLSIQANFTHEQEACYLTPIAHRNLHDPHVPYGPWAGSRWPESTLKEAGKNTIRGVEAWYSSVSSQIECKESSPGWMGRPPRPKDLDDLLLLRTIKQRREFS
ncbi:hypothetical protein KRX56_03045 [Dermabacteraceae bacterium TAE3-ERU27]|nr:hypothetical protein [Dermabacteraceae bacterium TAE3-ERU27]